MREESDDVLLARARGGDESAFHALAARHLPELYDFAAHLTADAAKAAAIVAFALRRATNGLEPDHKDARAWLLTMVRDVALERLPERADDLDPARTVDPDLVPLDEDERVAGAMAPGVAAGLGAIPLAQRSLLLLAVRHGFGAKELAGAAGMSTENGGPLLARLKAMGEERLKLNGLAQSCPELAAILAREREDGLHWREVRVAAMDHTRGCSRCQRRTDRLIAPMTVVAALAPVRPEAATSAAILSRLRGQWPGAAAAKSEPEVPRTMRRRAIVWIAPLSVLSWALAAALLVPASPVALTRDRSIRAPGLLPSSADNTPAQIVEVTVITPTPTPTRTPTATPSTSATASVSATASGTTTTAGGAGTATATATATATRGTPTATGTATPPGATATPVPPTATQVPPTATPVPPTPTPTACVPSLLTSVPGGTVSVVAGQSSFIELLNVSDCEGVAFSVGSSEAWLTVSASVSAIPARAKVPITILGDPPGGPGTYSAVLSITSPGLPVIRVTVQAIRPAP